MNSVTSDRDYLELVSKTDTTISASGGSDSDFTYPQTVYPGNYGVTTVTHGLGIVPFVRAYYAPAGGNRWYSTLRPNGSAYKGKTNPWMLTVSTTTTTKVSILSSGTSNNIPVHVRIYRFNYDKSVTSDEEMDKIFLDNGTDSTTLSAAGSSIAPVFTTRTIAHSGGADALATLEFSFDQVSWYSAGSYIFHGYDTGSGPPGGPYAYSYYTTALASSDDQNVYIYYEHNRASSSTIYVRYVLDYKD